MKVSYNEMRKYVNPSSLHWNNLVHINSEYEIFSADMSDDQIFQFVKSYSPDDNVFEKMTAEEIYQELQDVFIFVPSRQTTENINDCEYYLFPASDIGYDMDEYIINNLILNECN